MKKFLVLGFTVFTALFLAVGCDEDNCSKECKDWKNYGYYSKSDCEIDCKHYENGGSDLNEYILECINAGHSKEDCEAWYYED